MKITRDQKTWPDRTPKSGLPCVDSTLRPTRWVAQNPDKPTIWGALARAGHQVAWEFWKNGSYTGQVMIDQRIQSAEAAIQVFAKEAAKSHA